MSTTSDTAQLHLGPCRCSSYTCEGFKSFPFYSTFRSFSFREMQRLDSLISRLTPPACAPLKSMSFTLGIQLNKSLASIKCNGLAAWLDLIISCTHLLTGDSYAKTTPRYQFQCSGYRPNTTNSGTLTKST